MAATALLDTEEKADAAVAGRTVPLQVGGVEKVGATGLHGGVQAFEGIHYVRIYCLGTGSLPDAHIWLRGHEIAKERFALGGVETHLRVWPLNGTDVPVRASDVKMRLYPVLAAYERLTQTAS